MRYGRRSAQRIPDHANKIEPIARVNATVGEAITRLAGGSAGFRAIIPYGVEYRIRAPRVGAHLHLHPDSRGSCRPDMGGEGRTLFVNNQISTD